MWEQFDCVELCCGIGNRHVRRLTVSREASERCAEVGADTKHPIMVIC